MHKNFYYFMIFPVVGLFLNKNIEDEKIINLNITFGKLDDTLIIQINNSKTIKELKEYLESKYNIKNIGDKIFYKGIKLKDKNKLSYYEIKDGDLIEIVTRELKS